MHRATPFILFACVCALALPLPCAVAQPKKKTGPSPVVAGKVFKLNRVGAETFVGTLQAKRKSIVGSAVDGRVVELNVEPGDPVGADPSLDSGTFVGQPLLQLRTDTLNIEIGSAEIQYRLAEQAYQELLISLPNEIELAKTAAAEARARLSYSQTNYERLRRLGRGAISQGEVDQARSQFQADQQAAEGAELTYRNLNATKELRQKQAKLNVETTKQELSRLKDLHLKYTVRAPFNGFVTQKMTEVGEWVMRGQAIVEIVQIDPIEMVINVPQEHLNRLQQSLGEPSSDLTAQIEFEGIETKFKGIVKRVVAQADLLSRTFPVRVELPNPKTDEGHLLQPGMLGKASLEIGARQEMLVVKKDALVLGGRQPLVFKLIEQGDSTTAVPVVVRTGVSIDDWIQITGEVTSNDRIVLLGNERLRPGQKLLIKETSSEVPPS